ncbi:MAG: hypothetical protein RLZZ627_1874 [Pseudomonadota bacterium]|jgi:pyruvate-formate lyase
MAHIHGAAAKALSHGAHTAHGAVAMATAKHAGAAIGIAAATQTHTGKGLMSVLSKHPLLVFTLGVTTGYFAHKYRKEIIASATRATELGKDFVMHQKENLEDLVAECQECPEDGEKE